MSEIPSDFLNKCLDFALSLNRTLVPTNTFRSRTGAEFLYIGGAKHYPILVNERLYQFLQTIWAVGTVFLILGLVFIAFVFLSVLVESVSSYCRERREREQEEDPHPIPLTVPPGTTPDGDPPSYSECAHIYQDRSPPLIERYLQKAVTTRDSYYILQAFQPTLTERPSATGVYIEVTPRNFCRNFSCDIATCTKPHKFHIYVPCANKHHHQMEII